MSDQEPLCECFLSWGYIKHAPYAPCTPDKTSPNKNADGDLK